VSEAEATDTPPLWALHALPQPATQDWHRLTGGRINAVWRAGAQILKVYAPERGTTFFPNDPHAEARALRHLSARGLTPRLLGMTEQGGTAIAIAATSGDTPGPAAIARALLALHALPPVSQTRRVFVDPDAIKAEVACLVPQIGQLRDLLPPEPAMVTAPPERLALLHGDPVPANFVCDGSQCRMIDLSCACIGDPAFDLALALSPAMFALYGAGDFTDHADLFLRSYGVPDSYSRLAQWLHYRITAYCLWKAARGDSDYLPAARLEAGHIEALAS